MRYHWYVYESQSRWANAIRRFGPKELPGPKDQLAIVVADSVSSLISQISAESSPVVLWELPVQQSDEVLAAIAKLYNAKPLSCQLVAFNNESRFQSQKKSEISLAIRELGAVAVLSDVATFPMYLRLVRERWRSSTSTTNVTTAQAVWDQLPWGF